MATSRTVVVDRHGRIVGARFDGPAPQRLRPAPCDPYRRLAGACSGEAIVVLP